MNKLLTIAASLVLSLIAGLNATLMAKEQSPNLRIQLGSSQPQLNVQSDLQSDLQSEPQSEPQPESQQDLQTEQSTTPSPTPSPCLACGMG